MEAGVGCKDRVGNEDITDKILPFVEVGPETLVMVANHSEESMV